MPITLSAPQIRLVEIDAVDAVILTDMVNLNGTFIRAIRVFADPNGIEGSAVLDLHLLSTNSTNLQIPLG